MQEVPGHSSHPAHSSSAQAAHGVPSGQERSRSLEALDSGKAAACHLGGLF